jgi:hypothetical protein
LGEFLAGARRRPGRDGHRGGSWKSQAKDGLVLAGSGQRLIDGIDVMHLALIDSTRFGSGIVVNAHVPK